MVHRVVHHGLNGVQLERPQMANAESQPIAKAIEGAADAHLGTQHLLPNIKGRAISSGAVTASAQLFKLALNLGYTILLARLLDPKEFGLVAMATVVINFARILKDAGLSTATVQRDEITNAQVSNLFWLNVAISAALTIVVAVSAPAVAWFYQDSRIIGITLALSLTFLISGTTFQHQALLSRQMRFKSLALIEVGAMVGGYAAGVVLALEGWGVWSLVGAGLLTEILALVLTWSVSGWRPQRFTRGSGTRSMVGFGAQIALGGFIYSMARGVDSLLLGRFFGADAVGLYSRASVLLMRPMEQLLSPINAVFVPVLSRLQSDPERYRRTFLQMFEAIALMSFPFTGVFLPLSDPLVLFLLGPKWQAAAPIFAGFTIVALYFPLANVSTWLFASQGRGKDWLIATSIVSSITVIAFLAGLSRGAVGVAVAFSVSCIGLQLPVLYFMAGRAGPVRTRDLWAGFLRHLPIWAVVCAVTSLVVAQLSEVAPLWQVVGGAASGVLAAAGFIAVYSPSRRVASNLFSLAAEFKKSRELPSN